MVVMFSRVFIVREFRFVLSSKTRDGFPINNFQKHYRSLLVEIRVCGFLI